jgi:hypothetical protein
MPAKKTGNSKSNSRNPKDWINYEFVQFTLNEAQKDQFREWYKEQGSSCFDDLKGLLASGYKVSLAGDDNNNCVIATLTCKEPTDPNYAYCLSSRATDAWEALAMCLFKTFELCEDADWPKDAQAKNYG